MARTFLITGASGIAAETARVLPSHLGPIPGRLFLVARHAEHCEGVAASVRNDYEAISWAIGDLTNPEFACKVVQQCAAKFGRIDALFNVAGMSGRRFGDGPLHECSEEGWAKTLDANLTTQYRMCRQTVRVMLAQDPAENGQRGVILNMSSILGVHPEPEHFDTVAYGTSKGAIIAMSRIMAASYAPHKIRINVIAPGLAETRMSAHAASDTAIVDFMRIKQPLVSGMISVEDIAQVSAFLLTDASRAITGQCLAVDGGWGLA
ncbi:MAG TPA: SDR family oxidoreductase [Alloacidobacterium sp.]|jgi:NAD(P)-dependent dehydrogenase (short-subunit alcohol dehydrogenase family)|nr:SDR family oxidoreductase [Alloacidobacterium sp.]